MKDGVKTTGRLPAAVLAVLVLGTVVYFFGPLLDAGRQLTIFLADPETVRAWVLARDPYSTILFIGICTVQVIVSPIPGELACFAGGFIFGWWEGFIYSTIGLTIGSTVNVVLGRLFERALLEWIIPAKYLDAFGEKTEKFGLASALVLFLFPGAPKDSLCYLFGLTRIPIIPFLAVSSLARMPGTLVLTIQGGNAFRGDWTFFIAVTISSAILLLPVFFFRQKLFSKIGWTSGQVKEKSDGESNRS